MPPDNKVLEAVGRMVKVNKGFEKHQGYTRLMVWSRLPETITIRRGLRKYTYTRSFGDTDDRVFVSYSDDSKKWSDPRKVLMHYEETTLRECMFKAWRNLAENNVKVGGQK